MVRALVALGANLGDRAATLRAAVDHLNGDRVTLVAASSWHETVPSGGPAGQPGYLNGAALFETSLTPEAFFERLVQTEHRLGRTREVRWGPRTLDLDLLLYDAVVMRSPKLELPHPRLAFRRFVLAPAVEIAGAMRHPGIGWTMDRLLEHLATARPYVAITGVPGAGKTELARQVAKISGADLAILDDARGATAVQSGPSLEAELEFVRARRQRLASYPWVGRERWLISDFWLEQSLAYARTELPPSSQTAVSAAVEAARASVVAPKLTVLLADALDHSGPNSGMQGQPQDPVSRAPLDQLAHELSNAVNRPELGPVLLLDQSDLGEAARQLASALETMR